MPQLVRLYCSRCQNSVYNTFIGPDGLRAAETDLGAVRVPLVMYFVVGKPDDTGAPLDVNGAGVRMPAFIREIMHDHVPLKRAELCMVCVAEVFGTPCVTAGEDSMYSAEQTAETKTLITDVLDSDAATNLEKNAVALERVFQAVRVARGAEAAPALPPSKVEA